MGLVHHPHQIHMQGLGAGLLLVHHDVGLAIGIGQGGAVFDYPLMVRSKSTLLFFGGSSLSSLMRSKGTS